MSVLNAPTTLTLRDAHPGPPASSPHAGMTRTAMVNLTHHDPALVEVVPSDEQDLAAAVLRMPAVRLKDGVWPSPPGLFGADAGGTRAVLVLGGLFSRSVPCKDRACWELFGPEDVLLPCDWTGDGLEAATWAVHEPVTLALLGDRFCAASRRWPDLWNVLLLRVAERANRSALHLAALQQSRVDDRILSVFGQLADRFGHVTPDGIVLPLNVTHELLGRLVAAKRPTVSLALRSLAERGRLRRRSDGSWLLREV